MKGSKPSDRLPSQSPHIYLRRRGEKPVSRPAGQPASRERYQPERSLVLGPVTAPPPYRRHKGHLYSLETSSTGRQSSPAAAMERKIMRPHEKPGSLQQPQILFSAFSGQPPTSDGFRERFGAPRVWGPVTQKLGTCMPPVVRSSSQLPDRHSFPLSLREQVRVGGE